MTTTHSVYTQMRSQTKPTASYQWRIYAITTILIIALVAFEIFNFDTTRFALTNLLGDVTFWGVHWAAILAVAFCGIDFAGLLRIFTGGNDDTQPKEVWYLMAAWLLGATMNAAMTWYAVTLTLLSHDIGNEVVSRDVLLQVVPVFVAVLVWLTRILFIGSMSVAYEQLFKSQPAPSAPQRTPLQMRPRRPEPPASIHTKVHTKD